MHPHFYCTPFYFVASDKFAHEKYVVWNWEDTACLAFSGKEDTVTASGAKATNPAVTVANPNSKSPTKEPLASVDKIVEEEKMGDEGQAAAAVAEVNSQDKSAAGEPNRITPPASPPPPPKFDVIGLLEKGHSLRWYFITCNN